MSNLNAGTFEKFVEIVAYLEKRFLNGNTPFQIVTRLAEECGELASAVNHIENSGVKGAKHGEPDPHKLAKEVQDVMRSALQTARHYKIENALLSSIDESYARVLADKK